MPGVRKVRIETMRFKLVVFAASLYSIYVQPSPREVAPLRSLQCEVIIVIILRTISAESTGRGGARNRAAALARAN